MNEPELAILRRLLHKFITEEYNYCTSRLTNHMGCNGCIMHKIIKPLPMGLSMAQLCFNFNLLLHLKDSPC